MLGKARDPDTQAAIDRIMAALDFAGWAVLAGDVEGILDAIVADGAHAALIQVGIDVDATPGVEGIVNEYAQDYARARSAELVGMRRDELGRLVENPNAQWAITETTRASVRSAVADAIDNGWSNDTLAKALADSYTFSKDRAMTIARTETNRAANRGALDGYKASGVVDGKQWLTAEDDLVSEECQANGEAGPNGDGVLFDLDADFPSGDDAPPVHPNCRCTIAPYIDWSQSPSTGDDE